MAKGILCGRISIRLRGVVTEDVMRNKPDILSLSEIIQDVTFTRETDGEAVVN